MRTILFALLLCLPQAALAGRYVDGSTAIVGKWRGLTFKGRYRNPGVVRGPMRLKASVILPPSIDAGQPNGDVTGTARLHGRQCAVFGSLTSLDGALAERQPPASAPRLFVCFTCGSEDDGCTYSFTGQRP